MLAWVVVVEVGLGEGRFVSRNSVGGGASGYGSSSVDVGLGIADGCGRCSSLYRASWASMYRLIFNHSSCRDGISAVGGPPGELLVAGVPVMLGSVPGVVFRVGVGVGWGDGGRSCRGAVWGVEVVMGAVCFGVS